MQGITGSPMKRSPAFLNNGMANLEVQLPLIKQSTGGKAALP